MDPIFYHQYTPVMLAYIYRGSVMGLGWWSQHISTDLRTCMWGVAQPPARDFCWIAGWLFFGEVIVILDMPYISLYDMVQWCVWHGHTPAVGVTFIQHHPATVEMSQRKANNAFIMTNPHNAVIFLRHVLNAKKRAWTWSMPKTGRLQSPVTKLQLPKSSTIYINRGNGKSSILSPIIQWRWTYSTAI